MYAHFIIIGSSYSTGSRVGYHLVTQGRLDRAVLEEKMARINQINRNDVGVHVLATDSADWASVLELDSFFEDVVLYHDFEGFVKTLQLDILSDIDEVKRYGN